MKSNKIQISRFGAASHIRVLGNIGIWLDIEADIHGSRPSHKCRHLLKPRLITDNFEESHEGGEEIIEASCIAIRFGCGFGVLEYFHANGHIEEQNGSQ